MKRLTHLTIGTWNVNGLTSKIEQVADLTNSKQIDILVLTETKQQALKTFPVGRNYEAIGSHSNGKGGIAISVRPDLQYKRLFEHWSVLCQYIGIRVGTTVIVGMYISPRIPAAELKEHLEKVHEKTGGRAIIIGDLNGRTKRWCTADNLIGREEDC